jgi:hypothetical protein
MKKKEKKEISVFSMKIYGTIQATADGYYQI